MNPKTILLFATLLFSFYYSVARQDSIREILIGEQVPDIELSPVLQYKDDKLKISDFRGKLLILDFWSVHCTPCIASFPKMKTLQDKFADQIMILPVSFNNPLNEIVGFIEKRKGTKFELQLPTVVEEPEDESALRKLFPFYGMPHEVWIDKDGILRAVTDHHYVNEENINKVLAGNEVNWPIKKFDPTFSPGDKLFTNEDTLTYIFQSVISKYQNGKMGSESFIQDSIKTKITLVNSSLLQLIKHSLGGELFHNENGIYSLNGPFRSDVFNKKLLLDVKDSLRYFNRRQYQNDTSYMRWVEDHIYCYELTLPPVYSLEEAFDFMQDDISRFFKIKIEVRELPVKYLALVKISNNDKITTKGGTPLYDRSDDSRDVAITNRPIALLVSFIEGRDSPIILNETGIEENIDVTFSKEKEFNLDNIRLSLRKYGLDLIEKSKIMPVLCVSEL